MKENWVEVRKGGDFQAMATEFGISPVIARLITNREIVGTEAIETYMNGTLDDLHDGILLKDMNKAVDIIVEKIQQQKKIRVIGDYDMDGVNATYILVDGLSRLGAIVDSDIPERIKDGYGLNKDLIMKAISLGVDTIITCDNGITAIDEIAFAKKNGLTVIITDHHDVHYEMDSEEGNSERHYLLPPADAIVNPKQESCEYPFKGLCGAAVAYKLIETLHHVLDIDPKEIEYLIENVAIATVGDVMELIGENRIFVKCGIEMLKNTKNLGLRALMEKKMDNIDDLSAYHIGFVVGPCLNATGRLSTAKRALELLMAKSQEEAEYLAEELKELNEKRKELTLESVELAKEIVEKEMEEDKVVVVYLPECHESLAGIVAGRIRDHFYKPAYVLTKGHDSFKGSGRSIDAYHMVDEMTKCKEQFRVYGGHKLASGFTLKDMDIDAFRKRINESSTLTQDDLIQKIPLDMVIPLQFIDMEMINQLKILEPFGKGNLKPHFAARDLEIISFRTIGKDNSSVKLMLRDLNGQEMEGIFFSEANEFSEYIEVKYGRTALENIKKSKRAGVKFSFVFYPSINSYNGNVSIQLVIQKYR